MKKAQRKRGDGPRLVVDSRSKTDLLAALNMAEDNVRQRDGQLADLGQAFEYQVEMLRLADARFEGRGAALRTLHYDVSTLTAKCQQQREELEEAYNLASQAADIADHLGERMMNVSERLASEVEGRAREQTLLKALMATLAIKSEVYLSEAVDVTRRGAELAGVDVRQVESVFDEFFRAEIVRQAKADERARPANGANGRADEGVSSIRRERPGSVADLFSSIFGPNPSDISSRF